MSSMTHDESPQENLARRFPLGSLVHAESDDGSWPLLGAVRDRHATYSPHTNWVDVYRFDNKKVDRLAPDKLKPRGKWGQIFTPRLSLATATDVVTE